MEFGWINLIGAGILILITIPKIIYMLGQKSHKKDYEILKYLKII